MKKRAQKSKLFLNILLLLVPLIVLVCGSLVYNNYNFSLSKNILFSPVSSYSNS